MEPDLGHPIPDHPLPPLIPKSYRLPLPLSKEGRGSLYDRHRERVRSVDKLIGKWDGTGQGQVKERGKDMGTFDKVSPSFFTFKKPCSQRQYSISILLTITSFYWQL
jgi:hypothetical protein